jgi:hypothetical protein
MIKLLSNNPYLQFRHGNAEQDFISWYFRHTALRLPLEYNTMTHPTLQGNVTGGMHITNELNKKTCPTRREKKVWRRNSWTAGIFFGYNPVANA